ncbi:MAG: Plug domain-containing protein, partial [Candidatus Kapaibacterium sp.]
MNHFHVLRSIPFIIAVAASPLLAQQRRTTPQRPDTLLIKSDSIHVEARHTYSAASDAQFRAADFALRPKNSAQDILRVVPGLVIAQHAGGGKAEQIFLRGFDCDHGTDVNISVDDAPVNMVSHGHGQGYADLHFIIPETIERVNVAKGPYFARYGDLATAGAVAFQTADSLREDLVKLEADPFLDKTYRAVALLRAPISAPGVTAYFGGEVYSSEGYFDAPQDFRRVNLFAKARAPIGGNGSISAELLGFSAGWNASGQIPERAVENGSIDRFGSIDNTEGGATSRTTA